MVMPMRLTKPWRPLDGDEVANLKGTLGVYQLADLDEQVVLIAFAGGRSLFGLQGELSHHLEEREPGTTLFRVEENMQYTSRFDELLMVHVSDHGSLPVENDDSRRIGRLSPG